MSCRALSGDAVNSSNVLVLKQTYNTFALANRCCRCHTGAVSAGSVPPTAMAHSQLLAKRATRCMLPGKMSSPKPFSSGSARPMPMPRQRPTTYAHSTQPTATDSSWQLPALLLAAWKRQTAAAACEDAPSVSHVTVALGTSCPNPVLRVGPSAGANRAQGHALGSSCRALCNHGGCPQSQSGTFRNHRQAAGRTLHPLTPGSCAEDNLFVVCRCTSWF
jgi:hypothetical protein